MSKRRIYGAGLSNLERTMTRRQRKHVTVFPVCGECIKSIDWQAAIDAYKAGREYRHDCGKVLIHGNQ